MSEETTLLDAVTVLIERGVYKDRDALMQDALRALLRSKPELRGYQSLLPHQRGTSLTRAAEISGLDLESCKELCDMWVSLEVFHQPARRWQAKSSSSCAPEKQSERHKIVIDTDILSMFAKVGAMHRLVPFFGQGCIVMTSALHDEITAPLQHGYTYPTEVLT